MLLLVYCEKISPRLEYIFSTLFSALGLSEYSFTTDVCEFKQHGFARLNYSAEKITADECWIKPVNFLLETGIQTREIECFVRNNTKAFFETTSSDFPFDIFAASFYLLSRYEEYLPHTRDMYGRYAHENSLAFKEGFLHLPLVNIWLKEFKKQLLQKFPLLQIKETQFKFLPTYDIDIAWSYRNKGWWRNAAGMLKSVVNGQWSIVRERIIVLLNNKSDPFDSYTWLNKLHNELHLKPVYFFLIAQKNKGYDKNILPRAKAMQNLIEDHSRRYSVGIHPSWQSGDKPELLKKEIQTLKKITQQSVTKSRQHYIRMKLPETYSQLISAGITEDYSMGYGSINGFRASYSLPFNWYDLKEEKSTSLILYPFCFMDANSFYEQRFNNKEALNEITHYAEVVKSVNGLLITIWHNQFLGTGKMFKGWRELYETSCRKITQS